MARGENAFEVPGLRLEERADYDLLGQVLTSFTRAAGLQAILVDEEGQVFKEFKLNAGQLSQAARELQMMAPEKLEAAAQLLSLIAKQIVGTETQALKQRQEISRQQVRLGEEVRVRKALEDAFKKIEEAKDIKNLQVIQRAAEFMRNNYCQKISIEDIAQHVYLSPCYLSKIFKQELGCTIMEFLTRVRIDEAKKLLRKPQYNVMQVAGEIGFEDPSYFTKVFKRTEGITPSQFKRKAL